MEYLFSSKKKKGEWTKTVASIQKPQFEPKPHVHPPKKKTLLRIHFFRKPGNKKTIENDLS